ncbi:protein ALP1-like [Cornus florida]|uniref:protein ALP1-like n=1 Tax=Cornus florida TaxID=4283 RepID=UPI0028A0DE50|nr:protein ALP1-like [Cornus florida]
MTARPIFHSHSLCVHTIILHTFRRRLYQISLHFLSIRLSSFLSLYMKLTSLSEEADYSYIYTLLQDTLDQMNENSTGNNSKRRRRRKDNHTNGGDDGNNGGDSELGIGGSEKQEGNKVKALKEIITSLMLIDEQEKCDQEEWSKTHQEEKVSFEANHKKKSRAMLDYYSKIQNSYDGVDQSDGLRKRKSRAAAAAVAVTIAASAETENSNQKGTGGGGAVAGGPQRRLWVKNRSTAWWDQCNSDDCPEEEFRKAFRMGKETFDMICNELSSAVAKENTMLRDAVPVRQRVAVCIWRLATGEPLRLVSKRFGLGISTCHKLVLEVCLAIRTVLMPKFLQWPDEESLRRTKDEFESVSGIPNVVGSMYTTHIPIIAPKISVAAYFNRRHTERNQKTSYSITVQGVVDPKGVFTDVCIGWPGSMPDDQVLEKSALYQRANGGLMKGVFIVGSSGYPLMDWVLVPYTQQHLTWTQHAFNEKIGEVQRVAKEAFARLKGRWCCLQKRTEVKLQDLPVVLGACCVLHNICEMRNEEMDPELIIDLIDDPMVPEIPLRSPIAMKARDSIAHNLLHHNLAGTSFIS